MSILQKMRVGIIGSGRRVKGNYLPALDVLSDSFDISWVYSRTYSTLAAAVAPWNVEPLKVLDSGALQKIDVLAVSVPSPQNAPVLAQILPFAANLHLVIDTPVASSFADARKILPMLSKFKSVTVTEDFMNFPDFEAVRRVVASGLIGKPRHVILDGMGYYNHGLALIRSFANFGPVKSSKRMKLGGDFAVARFSLGDVDGSIFYPYRRYAGAIGIVGEKGLITSSPDALPFIRQDNVFVVSLGKVDGVIDAVKITGPGFEEISPIPEMQRLSVLPNADKSDLNLMRSMGLAAVFRSLVAHNINSRYGAQNAIYDSFVSKIAMRAPALWDPMTLLGTDSLKTYMKMLAR